MRPWIAKERVKVEDSSQGEMKNCFLGFFFVSQGRLRGRMMEEDGPG